MTGSRGWDENDAFYGRMHGMKVISHVEFGTKPIGSDGWRKDVLLKINAK